MVEVELKFPVASLIDVREKLVARQAQTVGEKRQIDEYFNDPLRDFASLDYALRIRTVDDRYRLTFKGPNLDMTAKMREEIELPLVDGGAAEKMKQVFEGIGFHSVAKVAKSRETMSLDWSGVQVDVCLDKVAEVGDFVELEIVVEDDAAADTAKQQLLSLAKELGLKDPIRTSYLNLLLQRRAASN